jgi:hypothetical protein
MIVSPEALAIARRAFPAAAPHALSAALEVAAPVIRRDALLSLAAGFEERGRCCGTDVSRSGWLAAARVARDAAWSHQDGPGASGAVPVEGQGGEDGSEAPGAAEREHLYLLPAEKLARTVATAQVQRGDSVPPNTAGALLLAIERLTGEQS